LQNTVKYIKYEEVIFNKIIFMSTLVKDSNNINIDKNLLNNIIWDVLADYIELKEDENTKKQIETDISMKKLTQNLRTTLWKL